MPLPRYKVEFVGDWSGQRWAHELVPGLAPDRRSARSDRVRRQPADPQMAERDAGIAARVNAGESMAAVGRDHGIGRERVRQIVREQKRLPA